MKKNVLWLINILTVIFLWGCAAKHEPSTFENTDRFNIQLNQDDKNSTMSSTVKTAKKEQNVFFKTPPQGIQKAPILSVPFENSKVSSSSNTTEGEKNVKVAVEDIPIGKFVDLLFSQILFYDYSVDDAVRNKKEKVTLNMQSSVSKNELLEISSKILERYGVYFSKEGNVYYVRMGTKPRDPSLGEPGNFFIGQSIPTSVDPTQDVAVFVPYYYFSDLPNMAGTLKDFYLTKEAYTQKIPNQNIFLVKDKAKNVSNLLAFVRSIDKPYMSNKHASLIYLKNINVKAFYENLLNVLPISGIEIAKKKGDVGILLQPIEAIKAIFIVAEKQEWIDMVDHWREILDVSQQESAIGRDIYVYKPKNRKASELATIIAALYNVSVTSKNSTNKTTKNNKNTDTSTSSSTGASTTSNNSGFMTNTMQTNLGSTQTQKEQENAIAPNTLKVIPDEAMNALVLFATTEEYQQIAAMLDRLDTMAKQVLIEVTIAELTLTDTLQYGLEWYLQNEGSTWTGTGQTLDGLALGGSGFNGSIVKNVGSFKMMMNAFAKKNLVNILSTPKIVVLDNQEASINVGTEVPLVTSQSSTAETTSTILQSIQYRNTGISLSVKPTVNSDGVLTLEISQEISEAQANNLSSISSPLILNRSVKTTVALESSQGVLLGGLISENKSGTDVKIPLLGDIPVIGNLFKTTSKGVTKTELLIMVRPIILTDANDARKITEAVLETLQQQF